MRHQITLFRFVVDSLHGGVCDWMDSDLPHNLLAGIIVKTLPTFIRQIFLVFTIYEPVIVYYFLKFIDFVDSEFPFFLRPRICFHIFFESAVEIYFGIVEDLGCFVDLSPGIGGLFFTFSLEFTFDT